MHDKVHPYLGDSDLRGKYDSRARYLEDADLERVPQPADPRDA
jgi:hypothetical protein